jgi:death-on-curing protein
MIRLTKKQVLMLHSQLIQETGGSDGVRDEKLLESALETLFLFLEGRTCIQAHRRRLPGYAMDLLKIMRWWTAIRELGHMRCLFAA